MANKIENKTHADSGTTPGAFPPLGPGTAVWLPPLAVHLLLSTAAILILYKLTGGNEIADDAAKLQLMVRRPFILWGDYAAAGLSPNWGSFPPLLPLLFGLLVAPWLKVLPDFAGFRLGILSWSIIVYFMVYIIAARVLAFPRKQIRWVLWAFVLLPSVWGSIFLIPQEEIYVSIFCLGLLLAARGQRYALVWLLAGLTLLAGKYFVLVLLVPLAFYSPRPGRYLAWWGGGCVLLLGAYISYHAAAHQLKPVLDHLITPQASLSVWALAWNLGFQPAAETIKLASLLLVGAAVILASLSARRNRLPLLHTCVITLYLALLLLSITFPAYVLWVLPMMLLCLGVMESRAERIYAIVLAACWGAGEWGSNFFRGVRLALDTERVEGKTMIAARAGELLGADFPFQHVQVACIGLVLLSGVLMVGLIWKSGRNQSEFSNPHRLKYPAG